MEGSTAQSPSDVFVLCLFSFFLGDSRHAVLIAPFSGRNAIAVFERSRKVHLIGIAYCNADVSNGKRCQLQQFCCFQHTIIHQKFLGRFSERFLKNLSKKTFLGT